MNAEHRDLMAIRSPEELRGAYPLGALMYYQPDLEQREHVRQVLTAVFPHHYINMLSGLFITWPADSGTQIGNTLFTDRSPILFMLRDLQARTSLSQQDIYAILPNISLTHLVGGLLVSVPRAEVIASPRKYFPRFEGEPSVFDQHGITAVDLDAIHKGMFRLRTLAQEWIYVGQHPDLVLTGIDGQPGDQGSIRWHIDESLRTYISKVTFYPRDFFNSTIPFPHKLALRGGLNISYQWNGYEWIALIPSTSAIGSLASELTKAHYRIVELGEGEVSPRMYGGVKCRSLFIRWKDAS